MTKEQVSALVAMIYAIARKEAIEHFAGIVKDHYRQQVSDDAVKTHAAFLDSCGCDVTPNVHSPASGKPAPDDPNAPFRWICIHCDTVSGIDDKTCLGCRKPRYPTLAARSGGAEHG